VEEPLDPMLEVLTSYRDRIEASDVLERLGLTPGEYLLASVHREENVDRQDRLGTLWTERSGNKGGIF